jgi:type II secretory pathway predicted ATPase ExeA
VLCELRLLAAAQFDSRILRGVVLAGDGRLTDKLRRDELLPLGSRIRMRLVMEYARSEDPNACLSRLLESAGNSMTDALKTTDLAQKLIRSRSAVIRDRDGRPRSEFVRSRNPVAVIVKIESHDLDSRPAFGRCPKQ